jgi:toxin ParE1/3/4
MRFNVSAPADQDIEEIFLYWAARASPAIADRIIDTITERFSFLAQYPLAGSRMDNLARGTRCLPVGKYLIYYRIGRRTLDIIHIFHGARNQERAFRNAKRAVSKTHSRRPVPEDQP